MNALTSRHVSNCDGGVHEIYVPVTIGRLVLGIPYIQWRYLTHLTICLNKFGRFKDD